MLMLGWFPRYIEGCNLSKITLDHEGTLGSQ